MASSTNELLAALKAGQDEIKAGQAAAQLALQEQEDLLRLIAERLGLVLEKLYPEATEGPSLQELLAELTGRTGDNTALLQRIDRRTESMAISLPGEVVRAMTEGAGANGNGGRGPAHGNGTGGKGHIL